MPPLMGKNQAKASTDAFIARVKEQLSSPENLSGNDEDAFHLDNPAVAEPGLPAAPRQPVAATGDNLFMY